MSEKVVVNIMQFMQANYFNTEFKVGVFDGIITDIPYKGAIKNKLNEENFDFQEFMRKSDNEVKENGFLITFANFLCCNDLISASIGTNWKFHTIQIWNKEPIRSWISWSLPLRHTEYIIYFKKGNFKFSFKDGTIKEGYNRSSFGGKLKSTNENTNKVAYGMFPDILTFKNEKSKIHTTEKPREFSKMFSLIVGKDKFVIDPFMGSGNLLSEFENSIGLDIVDYRL
jgi:DNA modification methylase